MFVYGETGTPREMVPDHFSLDLGIGYLSSTSNGNAVCIRLHFSLAFHIMMDVT